MSFRRSAVLLLFLGACRVRSLPGEPLPGPNDAASAAPDTRDPSGSGGGDASPSLVESGAISPPITEGGAQPSGDGGPLPIDHQCVRNDLGPVPPPPSACAPMVCAMAGANCSATGLAQSLRNSIKACGGRCGQLAVGFSSGCASDVRFFIPEDPRRDAIQACIRQLIVGKAWDCAPPNGWASLSIDHCTDP